MSLKTERLQRGFALGLMLLVLMASLTTQTASGGGGSSGSGETGPQANVVIKTLEAAEAVNGSRGIDVSKWQGYINWQQVATDDVDFVLARASIGNEIDETFVTNAVGAHSNGIKVGAYHFARFNSYSTMMAEAELFISQLRRVDITYPVALDVEHERGLSRSQLTTLCMQFMDEVKAAGYDVMLYSYSNFFRSYLDINSLSDYKLWVANYNEEPVVGQSVWQYTSYGSVRGIGGRVDLNVAYSQLYTQDPSIRVIHVDANISRSIKETLNQRYDAGLDLDTLNMDLMDTTIDIGFQTEVNRQFGEDYAIYPYLPELARRHLEGIQYVQGQTKGNITYLIQVRLFYKGLYHEYPTGEYDEATAQAVYEYQIEQGLFADGQINEKTLRMLL